MIECRATRRLCWWRTDEWASEGVSERASWLSHVSGYQSLRQTQAHTYMYTHMHSHTDTHTHIATSMRIYAQRCTHGLVQTHVSKRTHSLLFSSQLQLRLSLQAFIIAWFINLPSLFILSLLYLYSLGRFSSLYFFPSFIVAGGPEVPSYSQRRTFRATLAVTITACIQQATSGCGCDSGRNIDTRRVFIGLVMVGGSPAGGVGRYGGVGRKVRQERREASYFSYLFSLEMNMFIRYVGYLILDWLERRE